MDIRLGQRAYSARRGECSVAGSIDYAEIDPEAKEKLAGGLGGEIFRPGDPYYEEHRKVWNGSIDRHPALIARCAGAADVMAAVKLARQAGLRVAVRSGGHSFPGLSVCDGGLVSDLSLMKGNRVDPYTRRARAQAGVVLGQLDREPPSFGLAVQVGGGASAGLAAWALGRRV